MTMNTETMTRCDCCTMAVFKPGAPIRAWAALENVGWTRCVRQHRGGSVGYSHYCPRCSAKPNLAEIMRKRNKETAK